MYCVVVVDFSQVRPIKTEGYGEWASRPYFARNISELALLWCAHFIFSSVTSVMNWLETQKLKARLVNRFRTLTRIKVMLVDGRRTLTELSVCE